MYHVSNKGTLFPSSVITSEGDTGIQTVNVLTEPQTQFMANRTSHSVYLVNLQSTPS